MPGTYCGVYRKKPGQGLTRHRIAMCVFGAEIPMDFIDVSLPKPGTRVVLRYGALPYRMFGDFEGVVESVTEATLPPTAGATAPGYRVDAALKCQSVQLAGCPFALRPRMPLTPKERRKGCPTGCVGIP